MLPPPMKAQRPIQPRIDYHWPVDREQGFQKASLIYDAEGRLLAVDYEPIRSPRRDTAKATSQ
jgi:hypothetical protein